MDHHENKHCIGIAWYDLYHYKGGLPCGCKDNFDRVMLCPAHNRKYPTLDFEMPRQKHELEKVQSLLQRAYEQGRVDQMEKIRKTLKEIIGL